MDTLDEKVKEAFVDASPSHALSYNSVTKQVCPLQPACCRHATARLSSMSELHGQREDNAESDIPLSV